MQTGRLFRSMCLCTCLLSGAALLPAVSIQVEPFKLHGTRSWPPHFGKSLAQLLAFRLTLFPGIRAAAPVLPQAQYRLTASLELSHNRIQLVTSLYRRGSTYPVARTEGEGSSTEEMYRLVEACANTLAATLPGIPRKAGGPQGLDIAFCINLSGSMAPLAADLRRGVLETLNMLERTVPLSGLRFALLLYRGGAVFRTVSFSGDRHAILAALENASGWTAPGETHNLHHVLDQALALPWSSRAARILVLYSNHAGTAFTDAISARYRARNIRILSLLAPGKGRRESHQLQTLALLGDASGGTAVRPPLLIGWENKQGGASLLWDQEFVFLFRHRLPAAHLPLLDPTLLHYDQQVRVFRAQSLPDALRIAGSPPYHTLHAGLSWAVHAGLGKLLRRQNIKVGGNRVVGRILLESGGHRFWCDTTDSLFFNTVRRYREDQVFWLGFHPVPAQHREMRFTPHPGLFHLPPPGLRIPDLAQAEIGRLIANPEFYSTNGISSPPRWYLRVRLLKAVRVS